MIVACATDDGKHFVERHFGDANQYQIYEVTQDKIKMLATIMNSSDEETMHKDPKKARQIMELLLEAKVSVGASKIFGPNITRVREKIVPVLLSNDTITAGLHVIAENLTLIEEAAERTDNRIHIDLRK